MKFKIVSVIFFLFATIAALPAGAQQAEPEGGPTPSPGTELRATQEYYRLSPEQARALGLGASGAPAAVLALVLAPAPGWYAYAPNPDDPFARPPRLEATASDAPALRNFLPGGTPKPDPFKPDVMIEAYPEPTPLFIPLDASLLDKDLDATLTAVLCHGEKCLLPRLELTLRMPGLASLADLPAIGDSPWGAAFAQAAGRGEVLAAVPSAQGYRPAGEEGVDKADWNFTPVPFAPGLEVSGLFSAILLGMLAGLVLNAMPCVLPVVSLKLSAFLSGAAEEDAALRVRRFREHNLFFALGILLWFGLLAAILGGGGMAWGELFQSAWLVGALAALLFMLAMSLLGLFHLPVIDLKFDQAVSHPRLKALSTGMLATLLATPCSGPFLGGVLGWALLRPGAEIAVVFLAVGAGMALPYFVFIAFPGAARFFPRPGAWLAEVERAVALFLLGSCVYLVSILPDVGLLPWLISAWCLGTAWWLARIGKAARRKAGKALAFALALVLAVGGPVWAFQPALGHDGWTPFEPASFRAMLGEELLAVDFTADWCPTCKFLEATVLTPENVRRFSREHGARFVRVDLSRNDPAAEELLKALGSQSIPVMAVFPPGERASSPILIRDLFTAGHLEEALGAARGAEQ